MANFYYYSGVVGGDGTGSSWTNARPSLETMTNVAAGDTIFVADDHAETKNTANWVCVLPGTLAAPNRVLCVRRVGGSTPPVAADLRTSGQITVTVSNYYLRFDGVGYIYGLILTAGSSTGSGYVYLTNSSRIVACKVVKAGTGAGYCLRAAGTKILVDNTTIQFGAAGDYVQGNDSFEWRNTASAIQGAIVPTNLMSGMSGNIRLRNLDLSVLNTTLFNSVATSQDDYIIEDCRLHSSAVVTPGTFGIGGSVYLFRCSSSTNTLRHEKYTYSGNEVTETTVIRTNGATVGSTGISKSITTTANALWIIPYDSMPIAIGNTTTGSSVTATIYGLLDAAAVPNDDEVWVRVGYLGNASYPLGSGIDDTIATILTTPAAQTAESTSAWTSQVANFTRSPQETPAVGAARKTSSNANRVFFCTSSGQIAASEPGDYATAVDGQSVTDGGATFRAGCRFALAAPPFTPNLAGDLYVTVYVAKASVVRLYIDPKPVLS